MRLWDLLAGIVFGVAGSLAGVFLYQKLIYRQPQVYAVNLAKLKKEGFTKADVLKVLNPDVVLIDRKCVLNPYGRDITDEILKALKSEKKTPP